MAKKTKNSTKSADTSATSVKAPATEAVKTAAAYTPPAVTATPAAASMVPVAATPVAAKTAPVSKPNGNGTSTASTAPAIVRATGPVEVRIQKTDGKAVIRYVGPLATKADRVVARMGLEWFNSPRWQSLQDVEMQRTKDGVFEAEVPVTLKDDRGAELMAVQLAFLSPSLRSWDSAGTPYGYYQVSAVTGSVEPIHH